MKDGYKAAHKRLKIQASGSYENEEDTRTAMNEKKWTDHKYFRSLLRDIHTFTSNFADSWAPHFMESLLRKENATDYLNALDAGYEQSKQADKKSPIYDSEGNIFRLMSIV
mmetsp:Transcript_25191/g.38973  ORF Transcript_25191/g.38973 Transcript_25191/m.38973 type:complete len:111 (+) Transcript_25191:591-923(+)